MEKVACFFRFALLITVTSLLQMPVQAQQKAQKHQIYLKDGTLTPAANAERWLDSMAAHSVTNEPALALIHFEQLPTPAERATLEQRGITLADYIPDNTYMTIVKPYAGKNAIGTAQVYSITDVKPEWKAGAFLWKEAERQKGTIDLLISFWRGTDTGAIKQLIESAGGEILPGIMEPYGTYKIRVAANKMRGLASWYGVRYISQVSEPIALDIQSRAAVKGNLSSALPSQGGYGLLGDSVNVGVGDNTSGIFHVDERDRIINFNPAPLTHHGVHVNGIVGGAGIIDPIAISMTPHVTLTDHYFEQVLAHTGDMYHDFNMTITNNSYALRQRDCDYAGTYDAYSSYLDTLALQYPSVVHVFASGNDGFLTCGPYLPGFGTVGGGYQPSKNALLVGSVTDHYYQAWDESHGPVKDGRLKPEMTAIGWAIYSTIDYTGYLLASGTSMSSPQVASGMAVLTQQYKRLHGGAQPRADLLKAVMMNGTLDIGNPGPDYTYGYGVMDLYRSLQMLDHNSYNTGVISTGDSQSLTISVPTNTGMLKVMLYWHDQPANPIAATQLVNDLDLTVNDASGQAHLPLILDPAPARVNDLASPHADHLNNSEQVTIYAPQAGAYTIKVKGYNIPQGPQPYVVVYDAIPAGLQLTYPIGGEQVSNVDSFRVYWNATDTTGTFTVLFSTDDGANWTTISSNIPGNERRWGMLPAGVNSGKCLVRVLRNGTSESVTSQRFAINTQPVIRYDADASQCPGYVTIHWAAAPGATSYNMLRKAGPFMQVVGTTSDTVYTYSGVPLDEPSYVAMQPVIDGMPAYRSMGMEVTANTGSCGNPVSAGDLMIEKALSPASGRMNTSSAPGATSNMALRVRNLYNVPCSNYTVSYSINGGAWVTTSGAGIIPAADALTINIPGLPLGAAGTYQITAAIHNQALADPVPGNDTLRFTVQNISNDPIDLSTPFRDDFETMGKMSVVRDSMGVSPNGHWDFFNGEDTGRMRTFVFDEVTISGARSISMDERIPLKASVGQNLFAGTFNLSGYDTGSTEVRIDFDYVLHSIPSDWSKNVVLARGDDQSSWTPFYTYDSSAFAGVVNHARSLSLTDVLRATQRNFSASGGVAFGQGDVTLIGGASFGAGLTIDNFSMYTVTNDAELVKVVAPLPYNCGLPATVPLTVQVHNGVSNTLHNVQLFYSVDGGPVYSGMLDSIRGKETADYTFAQQISVPAGTVHTIKTWLSVAGDSYTLNDSIVNYRFYNSKIITSFPYLEDFETGDGGYYTAGALSTWQYGAPASPKINKAASGIKAWKTNLAGLYRNQERSYLYSPCFDVTQLANPMLSFSMAMDIENCGGTLCDAGYMEYSFDGDTWMKLGRPGEGTNWYDSTLGIWNQQDFTRWHVATIPLPKPPAGQSLHLRFVMTADPGYTLEGMAIDDMHIYDLVYPIYATDSIASATKDLGGNEWSEITTAGQTLAAAQPRNQIIGNAAVTLYAHDTLHNLGQTQYIFPRSYRIAAPQQTADSMSLRLYLTDDEVARVWSDTSCPSCSGPPDAYRLGITQYENPQNRACENGSLTDDTGGNFSFYPHSKVRWVPYDKGYYAEVKAKPFSEFWFNDGGPTGNVPAGTDYVNYMAWRSGDSVSSYWYSVIDTAVNRYIVEWSADRSTFAMVADTPANNLTPAQYLTSQAVNWANSPELYLRLKWTLKGRSGYHYSPIRRVSAGDSLPALVVLDARMADHQTILVNWTSYLDAMADHYILERAVGNGNFAVANERVALKHYGQPYLFADKLQEYIPTGRLIHYRLTAVLANGMKIVLPERVVEWTNNGYVVNIYPNPTRNNAFSIEWNGEAGVTMTLQLTDAAGRSIYQASAIATQWTNITNLQTANLSKGLYFIRIEINGNRYAAKIVFE